MTYSYQNASPLEGACCQPCASGRPCASQGALGIFGVSVTRNGTTAKSPRAVAALVAGSAAAPAPGAGSSSSTLLYVAGAGVAALGLALYLRKRRR